MSNVSAIEFERWLAEQDQSSWSDDLKQKAHSALLSFKVAGRPDNRFDVTQEAHRKDLAAFVAAYGERAK